MHPAAIRSGPEGFFWLFGGGTKQSERKGNVAIVYVRDALEHHDDSWSDNYESILRRVATEMSGQGQVDRHKMAQQRHEWMNGRKPDFQPLPDIPASKPSAVMLSIDSPGGVVSGLNETVAKLQAMAKESGVKLVAYADEMAASAAYALCCACSEVYCPRSAIVGSIGVISTMVSCYRANKADGVDVQLITSGARKADGHVLAPLTAEMVAVERDRVMKLARDFWALAGKARGLDPKVLRSYQASIYLGPDALQKGLVDRVASLDDAVTRLQGGGNKRRKADGNETDRRMGVARPFRVAHVLPKHG